MSSPAQVRSVEAINEFRIRLAEYEEQVEDALEAFTSELRRAVSWLKLDRPGYWKRKTKLAEDAVHEAKMELERCLMFPTAGERPSCREERDKLKKAQQHLEHCREKTERVRHWNRQIQHEMQEYTGRIGQLKRLLEIELPAARARLQEIVRRLDAYQLERAPQASEPEAAAPSTETPESQE